MTTTPQAQVSERAKIAQKTVAAIAAAVDGMAAQISSTDKRAARWTHDIAAFIRAFEIEDTALSTPPARDDAETSKLITQLQWLYNRLNDNGTHSDIRNCLLEAIDRISPPAQADVAALVEALKPFAYAAGELDEKTRDTSDIWESSVAMTITAGDLRRAAQSLARVRDGGK